MADSPKADTFAPSVDAAQVERVEKKLVEETKKEGGTVHEFNPDASPQEKAAGVKKVNTLAIALLMSLMLLLRLCLWD